LRVPASPSRSFDLSFLNELRRERDGIERLFVGESE
jgi:hypothetical protein